MARAVELARAQAGRTGENPAVGCVIVRDGSIIAEGATAAGGTPHAEEAALAGGVDAHAATAYVSLEPCARRTSGAKSCAQLLIDAGVARVVIAVRDPHPQGAGIALLEAAGVAVEIGEMEAEARAVNADFIAKWSR